MAFNQCLPDPGWVVFIAGIKCKREMAVMKGLYILATAGALILGTVMTPVSAANCPCWKSYRMISGTCHKAEQITCVRDSAGREMSVICSGVNSGNASGHDVFFWYLVAGASVTSSGVVECTKAQGQATEALDVPVTLEEAEACRADIHAALAELGVSCSEH